MQSLPVSEELRAEQVRREKTARDAALGRRLEAVKRGDLGPVLKRWVSTGVLPVSVRLRAAISSGDYETTLQSPIFGLPERLPQSSLAPLLAWCMKPLPRRPTSFQADDLVLAVMGTAISLLAASGASTPVSLARLLSSCGAAARETALGQFITQIQGAKAMLTVRKSGRHAWQQTKQMSQVAAMMAGQVKPLLDSEERGEVSLGRTGGRAVLTVLTAAGDRHIDLRPPEAGDWALMELARMPIGEADEHRQTWVSFAMLVICAAQAESGWFDLVEFRPPLQRSHGKPRSKTKGLVLSDPAFAAIQRDIDKWLDLGFVKEAMVVPPERGDYLTVKHRPVAGSPGPMGIKTDAEGTAAWIAASEVMSATPWSVPGSTLAGLSGPLRDYALRDCEGDEGLLGLIEGSYRRIADKDFYLPIYMDFRGRVYTRPTWTTYQGSDLQKSLCVFPGKDWESPGIIPKDAMDAITLHIGNLFGKGHDKEPLSYRRQWLQMVMNKVGPALLGHPSDWALHDVLEKADEPLQLYTALYMLTHGAWDRIPCQIDGTCNGLQHLTALFRDETAAPHVNLRAAGYDHRPADIYGIVAEAVRQRLGQVSESWARRVGASVRIDRDLTKRPVMVLPYGGTMTAIQESVLAAILDQKPDPTWWTECLEVDGHNGVDATHPRYSDPHAIEQGYLAFKNRELDHHPLLRADSEKLGKIVWECIQEVLPRPMAAMKALRDIARTVGDRSLEWSTGFYTPEAGPLWVIQAKSKASRESLPFRGFHLPNAIRKLKMNLGKDDVDPKAHTSGIVANLIHSLDASHLAITMANVRAQDALHGRSEPAFGAIHDCYITRPSRMTDLGYATREAFLELYCNDPLAQPVRVRNLSSGLADEFASWYDLADFLGVSFPERGTYDINEVLDSAWFFS